MKTCYSTVYDQSETRQDAIRKFPGDARASFFKGTGAGTIQNKHTV